MKSIDPITAPSTDTNPIRTAIQEAIADNRVILFMKGTPEMPQCGFSRRTVAALQALDATFAAVDVLPDPRIRQELSALSNWPTVPQLFVDGELVGGCDIVTEMYESGELAQVLGVAGAGEGAPALHMPEESVGGLLTDSGMRAKRVSPESVENRLG